MTKFQFSRYGFVWHEEENNLYRKAFPNAVNNLTAKDAIVTDGGVHYTADRTHLMEKAMHVIWENSLTSQAQIYYVEPTPEEWPSTNGLYAWGFWRNCQCQGLTIEQLAGQLNTSHNPYIVREAEWQKSPPDDFLPRYQQILTRREVQTSTEKIEPKDCYSDCLPDPFCCKKMLLMSKWCQRFGNS